MRQVLTAFVVAVLPSVAVAQASPVADAFRQNASQVGKNLMEAAEEMPASKYSYRPTTPQMSFAQVVVHLIQGNDYLCGAIAGAKAPTRPKIDTTAGKEALVGRLRESFQFCDQSLASVDDSKLGEQIPFFGGKPWTRAAIMTLTTGDWADHYSQVANYLRLNGLVPPTAKKGGM
jgi:uncharacterized damage-inducible protein DinB